MKTLSKMIGDEIYKIPHDVRHCNITLLVSESEMLFLFNIDRYEKIGDNVDVIKELLEKGLITSNFEITHAGFEVLEHFKLENQKSIIIGTF